MQKTVLPTKSGGCQHILMNSSEHEERNNLLIFISSKNDAIGRPAVSEWLVPGLEKSFGPDCWGVWLLTVYQDHYKTNHYRIIHVIFPVWV